MAELYEFFEKLPGWLKLFPVGGLIVVWFRAHLKHKRDERISRDHIRDLANQNKGRLESLS